MPAASLRITVHLALCFWYPRLPTRRLRCPAGILAQEELSQLCHCLAPRLWASHFISVSQSHFALISQLYLLWERYLSLTVCDVEIPFASGTPDADAVIPVSKKTPNSIFQNEMPKCPIPLVRESSGAYLALCSWNQEEIFHWLQWEQDQALKEYQSLLITVQKQK